MNTQGLDAPTTDVGVHGAGDEGVEAGSPSVGQETRPAVVTSATNSPSPAPPKPAEGHALTCPLVCCSSADDPAVTGQPGPFCEAEFEAILSAIFSDLDDDPFRVGDLLADAVGFIGALAVRTDHHVAERAAELLRRMEQRALWGPEKAGPPLRVIWAETP